MSPGQLASLAEVVEDARTKHVATSPAAPLGGPLGDTGQRVEDFALPQRPNEGFGLRIGEDGCVLLAVAGGVAAAAGLPEGEPPRTMRLEFSGPFLESLDGIFLCCPGERYRKIKTPRGT